MMSFTVLNGKSIEIREDGTWAYVVPKETALARLQKAQVPAAVVDLMRGLFEQAKLEILETGEQVLVTHKGDHFEFALGGSDGPMDITMRLSSGQIDQLIQHAAEGYSDPLARFRLVREFFVALPLSVYQLLQHSIITNPVFRTLINAKDLMHLHLVSPVPSQEPDAVFTLFFVNGGWNVANGLVGKPDRVFRLSPDQALELLKHGFQASKAGPLELPALAQWYIGWRKQVEAA